MSIRLRIVDGIQIALCAYETDPEPGDIHLHDGWHYALAAKFNRDYFGCMMDIKYPDIWAAMDTQKLRDANTRTDLIGTAQASEEQR